MKHLIGYGVPFLVMLIGGYLLATVHPSIFLGILLFTSGRRMLDDSKEVLTKRKD